MSENAFTANNKTELQQKGISLAEADRQLQQLQQGNAYLPIERPCTIDDGMIRITDTMSIDLCRGFARNRHRFTRFVPASGAASRMFQGLFPSELDSDKATHLRQELTSFPFYEDLKEVTDSAPEELEDNDLFRLLLTDEGLGLANKPKGLLPLHRSESYNRTAFAEHLHESYRLGISKFHFTVSQEHLQLFQQQLMQVRDDLGPTANIDVSFSVQSPQTDTIALDQQNNGPFLTDDGQLLFRPAGHGALLQNLEQCQGDLVLIRNIDNVVPMRLQEPYQFWTEILGGLLLATQTQVFSWLEKLELNPDSETLFQAGKFLRETFGRQGDESLPAAERTAELTKLLDRPIRICGMVPVSGQPGGGPFWAEDTLGQISPQIVEGVQIDPEVPTQQQTLMASTHFNPVNIACSLRDRNDKPYVLADFIDQKAAIITSKNSDGRDLLALERPGLWNGAMSGWNTLFIEMPAETFNPIKTVFDLLQPNHQPGDK
jgi:hypothetical protein